MQLLKYTYKKDVVQYLETLQQQYKVTDLGYLKDLLTLLHNHGAGAPTKSDIDKLIDAAAKKGGNKVILGAVYKKRLQVITELLKSPVFYALSTLPDSVAALTRLLALCNRVNIKVRRAQCVTCQQLPNCPLGKKYATHTGDISEVIDYTLKAHKDCLFREREDTVEEMYKAMQALNGTFELAEEGKLANSVDPTDDYKAIQNKAALQERLRHMNKMFPTEFSPGGKIGFNDYAFDGTLPIFTDEAMIVQATAATTMLFNLWHQFEFALESSNAEFFKKTQQMADSKEHTTIESPADIVKLTPNQLALPDAVFDKKLVEKSLVKQQPLERKSKKQLLYMLLDASGSMRSAMNRGGVHALTPATISQAFIIALARKMRKAEDTTYFRWYDNAQSDLFKARTALEYDAFETDVFACNYAGGGTNIVGALNTAFRDIAELKDTLEKAEVLLITDCQDHVRVDQIVNVAKVPVHILDIGSRPTEHFQLKSIATNYYKLNADELSITNIVKGVFGDDKR